MTPKIATPGIDFYEPYKDPFGKKKQFETADDWKFFMAKSIENFK